MDVVQVNQVQILIAKELPSVNLLETNANV